MFKVVFRHHKWCIIKTGLSRGGRFRRSGRLKSSDFVHSLDQSEVDFGQYLSQSEVDFAVNFILSSDTVKMITVTHHVESIYTVCDIHSCVISNLTTESVYPLKAEESNHLTQTMTWNWFSYQILWRPPDKTLNTDPM